jgi:hypothetical protein
MELFIIIIIILVLWFINNRTPHKKSNKEDFVFDKNSRIKLMPTGVFAAMSYWNGNYTLFSIPPTIAPPNATALECSLKTCPMIGQVCVSGVKDEFNWVCNNDKKWVLLPESASNVSNIFGCFPKTCPINGQLCTSYPSGEYPDGFVWSSEICNENKWAFLPTQSAILAQSAPLSI